MKKILRSIVTSFFIATVSGSCSVRLVTDVLDSPGDGIAEANTLTSVALGYSRYRECQMDLDRWYCGKIQVKKMTESEGNGVTAFIATHTYTFMELIVFCLLYVLCMAPLLPKEEEE